MAVDSKKLMENIPEEKRVKASDYLNAEVTVSMVVKALRVFQDETYKQDIKQFRAINPNLALLYRVKL